MSGTTFHHFFILTMFLTFFISFSTSDDTELQILLNLKSSLASSSSSSSTPVFQTWTKDNSPCNFSGIVCGPDGMVTEINLPQQGLSGGTLSFDSLCSLQNLEKLSFESNSLSGEITTSGLSKCNKLQHLDLSMNSFTGQFLPNDLSPLSQLKFLNLNASGFSGPFPWKSLENLTNLQFLSLGDNPFDPTPFSLQLLNLNKLYWLYLSNCSIHGRFPDGIGNLTLLQNLELSDNALFGEIPPGITNLQKLWQLELYNNHLTGKLPDGFGNLTSLINFDASNNSLEGDLSELKTLTRLQSLQLFENGFSGEIPEEFGSFKFLKEFSLYTNNLTGSLPWSIGSLSDFEFIDVSDNSLSGQIPPDMCKNGKMIKLLILQNNFSGEIPAAYADCASLIRFRVNDNSLSGTVPAGIWGLPNMTIIDLSLNQFQGSVGQSIGNAKSLAQLFLADNLFSGELPDNISEAVSLVSVDLRSNRFSGKIPAKIGQLTNLDSLHLENNLFSGQIPWSLGSCRSLSEVNLAGNSLSGEIPMTIGTLPSLNYLNLSSNNLSGEIPSSLSSLTLTLLDLSNNRLFGPIPESLLVPPFTGSFVGNPDLCSNSKNRKYPRCSPLGSGRHRDIRKIVALFIAGVTILAVSITCYMTHKHYTRKIDHQDNHHPIKRGQGHGSWDMRQFHLLSFTEDEVVNAVRTENLIGKGGSGNVYKVVLANGEKLAVKHIWRSDSVTGESFRSRSSSSGRAMLGGQRRSVRSSSEFEAEVTALSSVRHLNVVKLYCSITGESSDLLVYEYMSNGSLWDRMHNACRKMEMGWRLRYEIAVGSARGLDYLHRGCERPVIHRDVKSSNILLDDEMRPRIADFGLAKILNAQGDRDTTTYGFAGTHGYMAPECGYTNKVNEKSDVYSFGVVLMELVTGKRPVEAEFGESKDIVQWVCYELMMTRGNNNNNGESLVDTTISEAHRSDAARVLGIAVRCTTRVPGLRPSMRAVVQMLEEAAPR
ncbi:receptor-like protein kinase 7 [Impatiens glandulifera]|uniref:receptor-like protein kinase 7 n=1 Tax=Impatiens glandulifera TaxID=253017 RepID=UPI001FB0F9C6|nr:receptor-like protein kinase 7 [Impatiens glandulifera]